MKTMYRAYCGWRAEIETFDVVKETAKTVVYQQQHYYCGRERGMRETRENKESRDHKWFHEWDDAKAWLVTRAHQTVVNKTTALETARKRYNDVLALKGSGS